ncbi:DUF2062 domain-containing protein [Mesoterricola sediminis]|uniref:DUF2062 domain-containing protein n=1 Tax=Mesoterricola sediminis TaxID=2927980 RepID=A0AA48H5J1_9BACT|nr:DUF2062 domain-containing protein [Mesoterricola sediminis]BDU76363.1 hypothetical protein METESE_13210 [Mesoterricola sediminis]
MTDTPDQEAPAGAPPPKGLWTRLKGHILHPEMSPEQIALSFAIGLSVAFNPLLGLHTAIVLLACFLSRRLHRPVMLIAAFVNNPWTMVPIATASALAGNLLLGRGSRLDLSGIRWHEITWRSFVSREGLDGIFCMLKPILVPYLTGGFALCLLALPVGYVVMLAVARRLRRAHLHMPHLHLPKTSRKPSE